MLSRLNGATSRACVASLPDALRVRLQAKYLASVKGYDRRELPLKDFIIMEVAYRVVQGKDGNWEELEATHKIDDVDYADMLLHMESCGYSVGMREW